MRAAGPSLRSMTGPVTLSDVAREAGVSLATASRAINGSANRVVRPDLRDRVVEAAERLRYRPDINAQAMARGRTNSIGLLVHDIADPYFSSIARGVARTAQGASLQVILASTEHDTAREVTIVELLQSQRARAIVIAGGRHDDPAANAALAAAVTEYREAGGGVAVIGQPLADVATVEVGNASGARALALALHERGYRDVVVLGGPEDHLTARERRDGFVDGLRSLGVDDVRIVHGEFTHEGGEQAITSVLSSGPRPQLVFAVNDVMALGALAAVRAAGLSVPDDIALAGFDDITTLRDVVPGLTTVRIPLEQVGVAATELALGADAPPVRIETEVVLRESTPGV